MDHSGRPEASAQPWRAKALLLHVRRRMLVAGAILGLLYLLSAVLSLRLALVGESVTPVWPPTGIAVVAFLLFGPRVWPAISIAAFAVNAPISIPSAVGIAVGNTLAPLTAATLLRRAGFRPAMDRLRDVIAIVFLGALGAMLISATIGSLSLVADGSVGSDDFWPTWSVWWVGDAMGVLIVAPFLLSLLVRHPRSRPRAVAEASFVLASLAAVALFAVWSEVRLQYLVFPFLVWAAARFQQRGAAPAALIASGAAIGAAVEGAGAYASGTLFEKMVGLQMFNTSVALTAFVLAAVVAERERAREALERGGLELERRVLERTEELERTGKQLSDAQRLAHIGSWEWDISTDRIRWSEELYRIYGIEPRGEPMSYEQVLELLPPSERERVAAAVARARQEREPFSLEHRIVRPDGTERVLAAQGEVMTDPAGTATRMVGTAQDVTERRRAEDLLRRFIANAAHELRTPLSTIASLASMLSTRGAALSPADLEEALAALGRQGDRTLRLVVDLLDLSRAQHRDVPLFDVSLAETVGEAVRVTEAPANVDLTVSVPPDLRVRADPDRLVQVVVNLLTNAFRYGGNHVEVTARVRDGSVAFAVADDGPGVPEQLVPSLFDPFTRGVSSRGGSGLGLAIVQGIVRSFGGTCRYEPRQPNGARFVVELQSTS